MPRRNCVRGNFIRDTGSADCCRTNGEIVYLAQAGKSGYTMFCVGSELNAVAQYAKKVAERINRLE